MKVTVQLKETSQYIVHDADNTYQKGDLFCVRVGDFVYKYPIANIFRIVESYSKED